MSKKDEKKPGSPPPVSAAAATPAEAPLPTEIVTTPASNGKTALVVLSKAGVKVATLAEIEQLTEEYNGKLAVLSALLNDTTLPELMRNQIMVLVELAQPIKPGMEEMESRGGEIPRVNICQPTSQKSSKPEAARPGDLFTDNGSMLEKPFPFIPIYFHEENVLFPQGSKAPECKAPDGKYGMPYGLCAGGDGVAPCPNLPFGKQNGGQGEQKQTDCFGQTVVTVLTMDLQHVYDIPFAKTSYSAGRALMKLARGQAMAWKQSYVLDTEKKSGEKGLYYVAKIAATSKDNSADVLRVGKAFSELYAAQRKKFLAEYYRNASSSQAQAVQAENEFQRDSSTLDTGDDGAEPDVMPAASTAARSSKPM